MARRGATERRGSALMGQIIALVVLIPLAILVVSWVLQSGGPFKSSTTQVDSNLPVVLRTIRSANQLVTAQTEVDVPITGKSSSMLPGSDEKIIYYAVYNVTGGVDLSKMKDADITESNGTITIVLPAPEILSQSLDTTKSHVLSHEIGITSVIGGTDQTLMDQILATANEKAKTALLKDNRLLDTAKQNAKDNLAQLLTRAGVKNVVFVDAPQTTTPTVAPNITPAIPG